MCVVCGVLRALTENGCRNQLQLVCVCFFSSVRVCMLCCGNRPYLHLNGVHVHTHFESI